MVVGYLQVKTHLVHDVCGLKQLAVGGQTLNCAICRGGISGLDLFFTTGTDFGLQGLGGDGSGSVVSSSGLAPRELAARGLE
jgi:hypothetical protein